LQLSGITVEFADHRAKVSRKIENQIKSNEWKQNDMKTLLATCSLLQ